MMTNADIQPLFILMSYYAKSKISAAFLGDEAAEGGKKAVGGQLILRAGLLYCIKCWKNWSS